MEKNYLIVGASSGIGKAITEKLNSHENRLYIASRNSIELFNGPNIHYQKVDVTGEFELELPERLDGLVYCPGTINLKPFPRLDEEDFMDDLRVNFLGAVKVIQQALAPLKQSGHASIVLFSSVAVQTGLGFHASIASAKGAIEGLSRSLAAELAPNIRVNTIAPSLTDTPLASTLLSNEKKKEANALRHPLKRIGKPEDIAEAAVFLLSNRSSWISGQVIAIDGGIGALK